MSTFRIGRLIAALFFSAASASTFAFTNLDFEGAHPIEDPGQIQFLDWSISAPGWSHSSGPDTEHVFYGAPHVGNTQWYLLASATSGFGALAGNYSMSFSSGWGNMQGTVDWTQAYLAQTDLVPADAHYIELLATGSPFEVSIGGNAIGLTWLGGNLYRGDISAYAGLTRELRITNLADMQGIALTIDNVAFAVPLPAGFGLYSASIAALALLQRRKRTRNALHAI